MSQFQLPMTAAVLLYKDKETFVAHALEFDICAVENSEKEAVDKLKRCMKRHIEFALGNGWRDSILFPAPDEFWKMAMSVVGSNHLSLGSVSIDPEKVRKLTAGKSTEAQPDDGMVSAVLLAPYCREHQQDHLAPL